MFARNGFRNWFLKLVLAKTKLVFRKIINGLLLKSYSNNWFTIRFGLALCLTDPLPCSHAWLIFSNIVFPWFCLSFRHIDQYDNINTIVSLLFIMATQLLFFTFAAEVTKAMASKLLLKRRLFRFLQLSQPSFSSIHAAPILSVKASEFMFLYNENALLPPLSPSRNFCSRSFNLHESQGPLTIDYRYDVHFLVFHLLYSYLILRNHKKLNLMVLAFKFQLFFFQVFNFKIRRVNGFSFQNISKNSNVCHAQVPQRLL